MGAGHYIEPDHLGTPRVVIEVARNVPVWTWDLKGEAFGNSVPNQDTDGDAYQFVFNLRFPGQRFDAATGLNYNYFRNYDSANGRYVESDPVGLKGGLGTYSYSYSRPLSTWDYFGLTPYLENGRVDAPGVMGWVSCSKGSLKPEINENNIKQLYGKCPAPIIECTRAHEQAHVNYAQRTAPGICTERFWEPAYWRVQHLSDTDNRATELYAHGAQLHCLAAKLRQVSTCDEGCRETILRAVRDKSQSVVNILYGQYGIKL